MTGQSNTSGVAFFKRRRKECGMICHLECNISGYFTKDPHGSNMDEHLLVLLARYAEAGMYEWCNTRKAKLGCKSAFWEEFQKILHQNTISIFWLNLIQITCSLWKLNSPDSPGSRGSLIFSMDIFTMQETLSFRSIGTDRQTTNFTFFLLCSLPQLPKFDCWA